jgi:ketosteroid isomerase-like protein
MSDHSPLPRAIAEAYLAAHATRDPAKIAPFIADDVVWTISGPVDVLPFCGVHHGKAAVLDLSGRRIPSVLKVFQVVHESCVIDGDHVATLTRVSARRPEDGRVISYRCAHFIQFRDGKVVENLSLLDSFDAVEQVLGHSLDVHDSPATQPSELVVV